MSLTHPSSRLLAPSTRRSLAACIAAACSAVALPALATVQVTDCGDAGPGTLREALVSTDPVVDVSACTQIALTSGELVESHDYVQITGNHTIITSSGASRVLSHTGTGKLSLISLEIADGAVTDVLAQGGCIESQGNVYLFASTVRNCTVTGTTAPPVDGGAFGGGIHARGSVTLNHSVVRDNTVFNAMGTYSYAGGGGIFAGGALFVQNSTISGNSVIGGGVYSHGGGAMAAGAAAVGYSTISDNEAPSGGAIDFGNCLTTSFVLNSTISGNRSEWGSAGLQSHDATLHVSNSTIAFNALGNPSTRPRARVPRPARAS
ncbi:MAG TPA: hypothetical protein VFS55_17470 [Dokdonella sp.]|nr:hypothetical protein [Dokdonella sp.]